MTCLHMLPFSQPGLPETMGTGMLSGSGALHTPSMAPQTLPPVPSLCTCTGCGSSGTDTGTGTGMSSFNHGGFFRCKLLVLSCRASDIVPRLSSGLGEGRNDSQEGARLIPDMAHTSRSKQSALLQAVTGGTQALRWMTSQAPCEGSGITAWSASTRHSAFLRPAGPQTRCQRPQSQV